MGINYPTMVLSLRGLNTSSEKTSQKQPKKSPKSQEIQQGSSCENSRKNGKEENLDFPRSEPPSSATAIRLKLAAPVRVHRDVLSVVAPDLTRPPDRRICSKDGQGMHFRSQMGAFAVFSVAARITAHRFFRRHRRSPLPRPLSRLKPVCRCSPPIPGSRCREVAARVLSRSHSHGSGSRYHNSRSHCHARSVVARRPQTHNFLAELKTLFILRLVCHACIPQAELVEVDDLNLSYRDNQGRRGWPRCMWDCGSVDQPGDMRSSARTHQRRSAEGQPWLVSLPSISLKIKQQYEQIHNFNTSRFNMTIINK
ncbi:unnamed protein product [Cuscuta europaea]|uniref:Uncharacterized protein n=1 Tax=Cuscuta europaea TaxID=41803 RepID=A0A9P1E470_CUSEU|nr:unnamed protein product [Cuscuta europaea]